MKNLKVLLSILLVASLIVGIISFPTSAIYEPDNYAYDFVPYEYVPYTLNDEYTLDEKLNELFDYLTDVNAYYYLGSEELGGFVDGDRRLAYLGVLDMRNLVDDLVLEIYSNNSSVWTDDYFREKYDEVIEASKNMVLAKSELEFAYNICVNESNSGNYYSDDIWSDFEEKLSNANAVIKDNTIIDTRVNDAYWELIHSFNVLCSSNTTKGDVNNDGHVSILDATIVQKSLVGLTPKLNSSQSYVSKISSDYYGENGDQPNISDVTEIQKSIVKIRTLPDTSGWTIIKYPESMHYEANNIMAYHYYASMFPWYYN